jgi:hypothetical protein
VGKNDLENFMLESGSHYKHYPFYLMEHIRDAWRSRKNKTESLDHLSAAPQAVGLAHRMRRVASAKDEVMNRQDRLRAQREGGKVTRAHTAGGYHGHYDIAQHSFNMLLLLYELHPNPSVNLIKAISYHDLAERYTGDLPAPALLEFPEVRSSLKKIESVVAESMGLNVEITAEDKAWVASLDKGRTLAVVPRPALARQYASQGSYPSTRADLRRPENSGA